MSPPYERFFLSYGERRSHVQRASTSGRVPQGGVNKRDYLLPAEEARRWYGRFIWAADSCPTLAQILLKIHLSRVRVRCDLIRPVNDRLGAGRYA